MNKNISRFTGLLLILSSFMNCNSGDNSNEKGCFGPYSGPGSTGPSAVTPFGKDSGNQITPGGPPPTNALNCYPVGEDPCVLPLVRLYTCPVVLQFQWNAAGDPDGLADTETEIQDEILAWGPDPLITSNCVNSYVELLPHITYIYPSPVQCNYFGSYSTASTDTQDPNSCPASLILNRSEE